MTTANSQQPTATVIIASYNHVAYVEKSIVSVLRQTWPVELFVIDDGSQDGSVELLQKLQAQHGFDLRLQANQGLSRTLNEAVARSNGEYIVPFGSDDIMMPDRVAAQVAYMREKPEVGICAGNCEMIDQDGNIMEEREQGFRSLPFRRLDFDDLFLSRKPGPLAPTLMIRRSALLKAGGFNPEIRLEDVQIELAITHAGYFIDILDKVLAQYRLHPNNTYNNKRFMVDNILLSWKQYQKHPQYEFVRLRFLRSMFLKMANRDRPFARELLAQIPLRHWNKKVIRGLGRLYFLPLQKGK
jgi:alpha-1,3-rhamnosyltransferase